MQRLGERLSELSGGALCPFGAMQMSDDDAPHRSSSDGDEAPRAADERSCWADLAGDGPWDERSQRLAGSMVWRSLLRSATDSARQMLRHRLPTCRRRMAAAQASPTKKGTQSSRSSRVADNGCRYRTAHQQSLAHSAAPADARGAFRSSSRPA
jgi:hypothetical protein